MGKIEQGVLVVNSYANDERAVPQTIQQSISQAIKQLNQEGKRVINIISGPSVQLLLGMNHISYLLWEKDSSEHNNADENWKNNNIPSAQSQVVERQYNALSITSENVDNLLDTVAKSIGADDFEKAENYCSQILDYFPHNVRANILRLLIDSKAKTVEQLFLKKTAHAIANNPFFIEASNSDNSSSCPECVQIVSKLEEIEKESAKRQKENVERINEKPVNSPEELQTLFDNGEITKEEYIKRMSILMYQ